MITSSIKMIIKIKIKIRIKMDNTILMLKINMKEAQIKMTKTNEKKDEETFYLFSLNLSTYLL